MGGKQTNKKTYNTISVKGKVIRINPENFVATPLLEVPAAQDEQSCQDDHQETNAQSPGWNRDGTDDRPVAYTPSPMSLLFLVITVKETNKRTPTPQL